MAACVGPPDAPGTPRRGPGLSTAATQAHFDRTAGKAFLERMATADFRDRTALARVVDLEAERDRLRQRVRQLEAQVDDLLEVAR